MNGGTPSLTKTAGFKLAALCLAALLPTAAVAGALTDAGTQPGLTYPIEPSGDCALCHGEYDAQQHVEPWPTWAGSTMAHAGRDPLFWASLDVANNDLPGSGDFCLRCHAPGAWLAGRSEPPLGGVDGCDMVGNIDERNNDFDGVSCNLCHRMTTNDSPPPGEQSFYTENGNFWIDDGDCNGQGEPCRHGPYDYQPDDPLPTHAWAYSSYHEDSVICGNCHNVTNHLATLIDGGIDTGIPFPVERTYAEWQSSSFATLGPGFQTCQNCHMPDAQDDPVYASSFETINRAGDMPTHHLVGGNAWIPDVLRQEYPNLGLSDELTATRDLTLALLQNDTATVELSLPNGATPGQPMDVSVKVTNHGGHKLPTGYSEGRRMWINVQARDGNDQLFWESGAYDASTGVLTHDAQAKIYHVEQGIWNYNGTNECDIIDALDRPMFHFVLGNCIAVDNRIPPLGFTGGSDPEIMPVGYSYPETFPGSGVLVNYDVTPYTIPIPGDVITPVSLTATLYYQTTSKDYVDFLYNEAIENGFADDCIERTSGLPGMTRAEVLKGMWEAYGRSAPVDVGVDVQAVGADLDGDGFAPPADCDDTNDQIFPGATEVCDATDNDCDGLVDEDTVCALCDAANVFPLATQTSKLVLKLIETPARDKVIAKGAFVMPDAAASAPDSEDVTLQIVTETGEFYSATVPAPGFVANNDGDKYDYKDSSRPYENGGLKVGKFSRKGDGTTLAYTFKALDLDHRPFAGTRSTVTVRIGDKCYQDTDDTCEVAGSGKTVKCR